MINLFINISENVIVYIVSFTMYLGNFTSNPMILDFYFHLVI